LSRLLTWLVLGSAVLGLAVLSEQTWRRKRAEREIRAEVEATDRYVDMGVLLRVVEQDPAGEELVPGCPPLRVLREHRFGGLVDTAAVPPCFIGPSSAPVVWHCSVDQEDIILHDEDQPLRRLVYGSMGAGKTAALARWLGLRALERTGVPVAEIGATAPTGDRTEMIAQAVREAFPSSWYTWRESDGTFTLANGVTIRLVSTHQASKAEGSRVQGYNWTDAASDEIQDSLAVDSDIEARGRKAPGGRYRRFCTATAKDDPAWRDWVARCATTDIWGISKMLGTRSPFIDPSYWVQLASTMPPRDYRRKVLAEDVGPERMTYTSWTRQDCCIPRPLVGAEDVTAQELAAWGRNRHVLVGHDPGRLFDVSIILKAYRVRGIQRPVWWVVDEVTTEQETTDRHVSALLKRLRDRWKCNLLDWRGRPVEDGATALVRADPYTSTGADEEHPDQGVYTRFRNAGLHILAAAYVAGTDKVKVARVPKEGRIDLVNTLLLSESGERRLFVDCDDRRQPAAPRLVAALEQSERDGDGKAEKQRKDKHDLSHWPSALGYALYAIERPRLEAARKRAST
jgi:hypothetical protein